MLKLFLRMNVKEYKLQVKDVYIIRFIFSDILHRKFVAAFFSGNEFRGQVSKQRGGDLSQRTPVNK